jgi:hypothetical protein
MSSSSSFKSWLWRKKLYFMIGAPLLWMALAPFPGMGLIYAITDPLRGHPLGRHGNQPEQFVGLWVRDRSVMYDFVGQAFCLLPDGRLAGMTGMTERRWHFDNDRLFIDAVSHCGNCFRGNVTTECKAKFVSADQMVVTNTDESANRGIGGTYRRLPVDASLKSKMAILSKSPDESISFRARMVLQACERAETLSKLKT